MSMNGLNGMYRKGVRAIKRRDAADKKKREQDKLNRNLNMKINWVKNNPDNAKYDKDGNPTSWGYWAENNS